MNWPLLRKGLIVLTAGIVAVWATTPAPAIEQFYNEFKAKYSNPKSKNRKEVALSRAIEQAKCTICHPNNDKHRFTSYGTAVAVLINKFDKGKKQKIQETFDKVANRNSDSYDKKSPTFGEQIKQGKIPEGPD